MSLGRKALPDMAFSTAGTMTRNCTFRPRDMIIWASPRTVAAPPMSFFIRFMPDEGLMFSPPVSKQTPLPTRVSLGPALPQRISMMRGARGEARPTAWTMGKFCVSRSSPLITVVVAPKRWARAEKAASSSAGPMSEAGVLTRSRVRNSASAMAKRRGPSVPSGRRSRAVSVFLGER